MWLQHKFRRPEKTESFPLSRRATLSTFFNSWLLWAEFQRPLFLADFFKSNNDPADGRKQLFRPSKKEITNDHLQKNGPEQSAFVKN
jgi:hypothetical protein